MSRPVGSAAGLRVSVELRQGCGVVRVEAGEHTPDWRQGLDPTEAQALGALLTLAGQQADRQTRHYHPPPYNGPYPGAGR